jgi:hypothetical protein
MPALQAGQTSVPPKQKKKEEERNCESIIHEQQVRKKVFAKL